MPCFHPMLATNAASGRPRFIRAATLGNNPPGTMRLACGQCRGCRLEGARQWAVRMSHEAQMHEKNCFLTLTYDDEHLPENWSLNKQHMKKFFKAFRYYLKSNRPRSDRTMRYFHCGEYGEKNDRPHYHAIIFGQDFTFDRVLWKHETNGNCLYRSAALERLWPNGFSSIGDVSFQSAAYVARYCMKKRNGPKQAEHYQLLDPVTGEIHERIPEYATMSRRPGIGQSWFEKYHTDVFPSDEVISDGHPARPPKYYDTLLERRAPELREEIRAKRIEAGSKYDDNNTRERLDVRDEVLRRKLEDNPRKV